MSDSIFVTYHIKLFPRSSPRKLKVRSDLDILATANNESNKNNTVLAKKRQIDLNFKSSRKLQQYRLIRFVSNAFNEFFFIRLSILLWKQHKDDSVTSNTYWLRMLKTLDRGFYNILNITDLWFLVFVFPIVSYGDSLWFNVKLLFSRTVNNLAKDISPLAKWFEKKVSKKMDFIFLPLYLFLINSILLKFGVNYLKNDQPSSETSGLFRLIYLIFKIKLLLFDFLVKSIVSIFRKPVDYLIHINSLLNHYLSHQNRINVQSISIVIQSVIIILWLELNDYFGKGSSS